MQKYMTKQEFKLKIEDCLKRQRQALYLHGGDVELVEANPKSGVVKLRLLGTCEGCPMAEMTLKEGIETVLKEQVPQVKKVQGV